MDKKVRDLIRETESKLHPTQDYEEEDYEEERSLDLSSIALAVMSVLFLALIAILAFAFLNNRLLNQLSNEMRLPIIIVIIIFLFVFDGSPLRRIFRGVFRSVSNVRLRRRRPPRKEIYY